MEVESRNEDERDRRYGRAERAPNRKPPKPQHDNLTFAHFEPGVTSLLGWTALPVRLRLSRNQRYNGEIQGFGMNVQPLASDEPLSPELVLVLPPELRAQALARLGPAVWPAARPRPLEAPAPPTESFVRAVGAAVLARVAPLVLVFVVVTLLTLAMSLVAQASR